MSATRPTLALIRLALVSIPVIGLLGTAVELLLLRHTDGSWQLFPLGLTVAGLIALGWLAVIKGGRPWASFEPFTAAMTKAANAQEAARIERLERYVIITP